MKNRVCKTLKTAICIALIIGLCGCWNRRELDTLGIVMGVGIDKPKTPGKVQITAQIVKPGGISPQNKDTGNTSQAFWNITGIGDDVFSTLRELTSKSSRKLFFPHNQVIIIDKSIARDGIQKYIDFFMRDPETRINVLVSVSQNKASDVLKLKSDLEKVPANNIAKLLKIHADSTSETKAVLLGDIIPVLMSKTTSLTLPFVNISGNSGEKIASVSGTAVFKKDKMIGQMNKTEGRGLMWVLGDVKSGIIDIKDFAGNKVSLEIIRAKSKVIPKITNNKVSIEVKIMEEGNIGEQVGPENLSELKTVASLERRKSEAIKNEVLSALKKAKKLDADIFGFGDAVQKKYPKQWKKLEGNWNEIFRTLQVKVAVRAKIRLMGRIIVPSVPVPKKEKK